MRIRSLCRENTDLSHEDIMELEKLSTTLQTTAELVDADVFLDCLTEDRDRAIVVAEARPLSGKSNYDESVVGKFAYRRNEPAALRTLNTGLVTRGLKAITQENKIVRQHTVPVRNHQGRVIAVLIIEQDPLYMDRMESDILLKPIYDKEFEKLPEVFDHITMNMEFIIENIDNSVIIFDSMGRALYANDYAEKLYEMIGYIGKIIGLDFDSLVLDDKKFSDFKTGKYKEEEFVNEIKIDNHYLEVKYNVMKEKEELIGINMIVFDVTEKKEKEKELILKSVVIKEIHHRVKNNLQTIVSLLRLQSRRVDEPYIRKAFNESISRISSIAIIHELLAEEGIDEIYIKDILNSLKNNMLRFIERPDLSLTIDLVGDNFIIDSDRSTSIALIVNELIQNSIEHAFKDRADGRILIGLKKSEEEIEIKISDDGIGFDVNSKKDYNLGLKIVEQLVRDKLDGELEISSSSMGTETIIKLKI